MKVDIHHTYSVTEINSVEIPDGCKEITEVYVDGMDLVIEGLDANSKEFRIEVPAAADNQPDYSRPDTIQVYSHDQGEDGVVSDFEVLYDWSCV